MKNRVFASLAIVTVALISATAYAAEKKEFYSEGDSLGEDTTETLCDHAGPFYACVDAGTALRRSQKKAENFAYKDAETKCTTQNKKGTVLRRVKPARTTCQAAPNEWTCTSYAKVRCSAETPAVATAPAKPKVSAEEKRKNDLADQDYVAPPPPPTMVPIAPAEGSASGAE